MIFQVRKRKLIVPRNDAPSGRLMRSVRDFTATEFVCFRWESIGLAEEWRTKKLGGYAADYQLKDADNDGEGGSGPCPHHVCTLSNDEK